MKQRNKKSRKSAKTNQQRQESNRHSEASSPPQSTSAKIQKDLSGGINVSDLHPLSDFNPSQLQEMDSVHPGFIERLIELTELETRQKLKSQDKVAQSQVEKNESEFKSDKQRLILEWVLCGTNLLLAGMLIANESDHSNLYGMIVIIITTGFIAFLRSKK